MSDLQMSLLAIGAVVVAGVYGFNVFQERRYGRKMEKAFHAKPEDILINDDTTSEPRVRVEPVLSKPVEPEVVAEEEVPFDYAPPEHAAPHIPAPSSIPESPNFPAFVDIEIECVAHLRASEPIRAESLWEAMQISNFGKPLQWLGLSLTGGDWEPISLEADQEYLEVIIAMQLADRSGPAGTFQIDAFFDMVNELAKEVMAIAELPDRQDVLTQAVALDEFGADSDIEIGFHLIKQNGEAFAGTKIRGLAEASGFKLGGEGVFEYFNDRGELQYILKNYEQTPFTQETLKQLSTHSITFLLDVPRVVDGLRVFDQLVLLAKRMAHSLDAALVDDNRKALNDAALASIRAQVKTIYARMDASNVKSGSPRALRLFS